MNVIDFLRQFRIGDYAIFDFAASFLGMFLLAPLLSKGFQKLGIVVPRVSWLYLTLPLSILAHLSVGSMTPMTINFLDPGGHYLLKIVIVLACVMGFKDVKRIR